MRDHENNKTIVNTRGVRTNQPKPARICGVTHSLVILRYKTYTHMEFIVEGKRESYTQVTILTTTASLASLHCGAVELELLS